MRADNVLVTSSAFLYPDADIKLSSGLEDYLQKCLRSLHIFSY